MTAKDFKVGQKVRIVRGNTANWCEPMYECIGKIGTVCEIYDKFIHVEFEGASLVYYPDCLVPVDVEETSETSYVIYCVDAKGDKHSLFGCATEAEARTGKSALEAYDAGMKFYIVKRTWKSTTTEERID